MDSKYLKSTRNHLDIKITLKETTSSKVEPLMYEAVTDIYTQYKKSGGKAAKAISGSNITIFASKEALNPKENNLEYKFYEKTAGSFNPIDKELKLKQDNIVESNMTTTDKIKKIQSVFSHELGHGVDQTYNSPEEEKIRQRLNEITDNANSKSNFSKAEEEKILTEYLNLLESLSKVDEYSDTDSFKSAYLKDLKSLEQLKKKDYEAYKTLYADNFYYLQGVNLNDGIDNNDTMGKGPKEAFAEAFGHITRSEKYDSLSPTFKKLFINTSQEVRKYINEKE